MTSVEKERRILQALTEPMSSKALADFAGLTAYQFYTAILRLEHEGKVLSDWELGPRPRRRIYRLPE